GYLFRCDRMREQIRKEAQGSKVYGISSGRLSTVNVCFPAKPAEQQKIADCLTSLDELIAAHARKVEALRSHKKGLMQHLFPRERLEGKVILVKCQFATNTNDYLISKRQIVHDACGLVPEELDGSVVSNEYSVLTPTAGCDIEFFNFFAQQPCVSSSFLQSSV